MNWLLYLGGWFLGAFTFGSLSKEPKGKFTKIVIILISWTMVWIWICWRFIA